MGLGTSGLDIFQQMPPGFYETLDVAFESAGFKDLAEIRRWAQKKARKLEESYKLGAMGMSKEGAEVLISFTYEGANSEDKPSYLINKAIAERNSNSLRAYRGYILHLLRTLRGLRPIRAEGTTLYKLADGRLDEGLYRAGSTLTWPGFTFTTQSEDAVYGQSLEEAEQPIIFEIHGDFVGYDVQMLSAFPDEDEILLEPGTVFRVVSVQQDARIARAKRVVVVVQQTPLMIEGAVENFKRAGCGYVNNNGGFGGFNGIGQMQYMNGFNNGFGQPFNQQN